MEQQAWILQSFLAQLERQEAVDEEAPKSITGEFVRLKNQSTKYRTEKTYPSKMAENQQNFKKNRYKDIVPFDHSRVKLTLTTSGNDKDYINASFIMGVTGSRAYIATQGPLPHTILDYLRMLWEYNVKVIVMACREFEMGKKKCERYWPQTQEETFVCESFTVYCDSEENKGDYLTRTLRVTFNNCSRTLKQLHYFNWPDHGVPDSIPPILDMLKEMRTYQSHDDIPICIHCSAGCGRTGALCVIDYTWNLLKNHMIPPDFNIYDLVHKMRTQRPSVVQTKEQYKLVYRTIKFLFERYLQSMDAPTCRKQVTMVLPASTPEPESQLSCLSEDLVLQRQVQHVCEDGRDVMQHHQPILPSAPDNVGAVRAEDKQRDQQQRTLLHLLPEPMDTTISSSPKLVQTSQRRIVERIVEGVDKPSLDQPLSLAMPEGIRLLVEDPYFDTPMCPTPLEEAPVDPVGPVVGMPSLPVNDQILELSSPAAGSVGGQTDEDAPPPVPERTPESYELSVNADNSGPCERLAVIIPSNAAAAAVRELGGCPPSPVPPLPERTPESFVLAVDQAPVEQQPGVRPAVMLNSFGMSSEWSGNCKPAATASQREMKPWARSKSLRVKPTFTVSPAPVTHSALSSRTTSNLYPHCPRLDPLTSPLRPQTEESLTPPLPDRTPESFILTAEESQQQNSQPKTFLDVVMSKNVQSKRSKQEPLTAVQQLVPPPMVVAGGGSAQVTQHDVNERPSLNTEMSGNKSDKSNEKGLSRSKSLKLFRNKLKSKPPPPAQPGPAPTSSNGASSSVFRFGFGNRLGKPKGPRSYPESWF